MNRYNSNVPVNAEILADFPHQGDNVTIKTIYRLNNKYWLVSNWASDKDHPYELTQAEAEAWTRGINGL